MNEINDKNKNIKENVEEKKKTTEQSEKAKDETHEKNEKNKKNKKNQKDKKDEDNKLVGPGLGLILLGIIYFIWYIMPFSFEYLEEKPLAIHNWGYSIIFLTVGLAWYQKSVVPRLIAVIQSFFFPVLSSGSFNPNIIVIIIFIIFALFCLIVFWERRSSKYFLKNKLQKHTWIWLNMHILIISYLLIMHIGFVFLIQRAPQEIDLLQIGPNAGWLANYTPEIHEISTWLFDISIITWGVVVLYEHFKMGYNLRNKPWPRWSFWFILVAIGMGLIGLLIQQLTYGFEINNILDLIGN